MIGFHELHGAQSESCQPIALGFEAGAETYVETQSRPSIAEGIAVSHPIRSRAVLSAARESGGGIYAVSEDAISAAHAKLARTGLYVEPTTAAAPALLDELIGRGIIRDGEKVVVVLTGSGLKAGELIARMRD